MTSQNHSSLLILLSSPLCLSNSPLQWVNSVITFLTIKILKNIISSDFGKDEQFYAMKVSNIENQIQKSEII